MKINVHVESRISDSYRARALEGMFDVPRSAISALDWAGELPIENRDWNVGLIVGPSGSGKTSITRQIWGEPPRLQWGGASVVDDFAADLSMEKIAGVCQAVGFNTVPAWLRPYAVLSTGEQFRVEIARRLLETPGGEDVVIDEFTSVVDRQVAKIGAHAAQKYVRKNGMRFVGVSCHYDIIDWLRPDWTFQPAMMQFTWGSDQQARPPLDVTVAPVPIDSWRLFAPFHYLTADLNKAARCWCLFVGDRPAAFAGVLHRPTRRQYGQNIKGISRLVTLPDWQGLGLAFVLADYIGSVYKAAGFRLRSYPAHPALIHAFDRSPVWRLAQKPGQQNPNRGSTLNVAKRWKQGEAAARWHQGERPCGVFEYVGPAGDAQPLDYWARSV